MCPFDAEPIMDRALALLPKVLAHVWAIAKRFYQSQEFLDYATVYHDVLSEQCSKMKILSMEQPVPLDDIYTEVRIVNPIKSRMHKSIAELEHEQRERLKNKSHEAISESARKTLEGRIRNEWSAAESARIRRDYKARLSHLETQALPIGDDSKAEHSAARNSDESQRMLAALKRERSQKLRKLEREALARTLTPGETRKVFERLPEAIERELDAKTRDAVNKIVYDDFGHLAHDDMPPQPAWDVINAKRCTLILGQPGAGKTTFLKHVVMKHLSGEAISPCWPFYIVLREFHDSKKADLLEYLAWQLTQCGFDKAQEFLERLLDGKYECLLLLDGLDEVSRERQPGIVRDIVWLTRRFKRNRYIVSCRTANYRGELEGFTDVRIAEFGPQQVSDFAHGWFSGRLADDFLSDVKRSPGLQELTTTPLLLALLCIAYKRHQKFPGHKAGVYLSCLDALLVDWDSSKQLLREQLLEGFDVYTKKQLLGEVACETFCEDALFFTEEDIVQKFNANSRSLPIKQNSGNQILKEFVENHGLIIERASGIFSFSHLTIQEFLTAFHVKSYATEVHERLVTAVSKDQRWCEVAVFLGGLLNRVDVFAIAIRNEMKTLLANSRIQGLPIGDDLPEAGIAFIDDPKTLGEASIWEAWFRWKLLEYRIHRALYGRQQSTLVSEVALLAIGNRIAECAHPKGDAAKRPYRLKPRNRALNECILSIPEITGQRLIGEEGRVRAYFRLASVLVEILASGPRIDPTLRPKLLVDIGTRSTAKWRYPSTPKPNMLRE